MIRSKIYAYASLAFIILISIASADSQSIEVLRYTPEDDFGYTSVAMSNSPENNYQVTLKELNITLYYNGYHNRETLIMDKPVTIPARDGEGYAGWVDVQIEKPSDEFRGNCWNITAISVIGRIYVQGEDLNSYKPLEAIDFWKIDPKAIRNVTNENRSVFHGESFNPPVADYAS